MDSMGDNRDNLQAFLSSAEGIVSSLDTLNDNDRAKVLLKVYELTSKIESPWETLVRLFMSQPATSAALKILGDLNLWKKWNENGSNPMSSIELAKLTGGACDPALLHRLIRVLAANHLIEITPDNKFKPGELCTQLARSDYSSTIQFYFNYIISMCTHMPSFFAKTGYLNPHNNRKTVFDSTFNWEGGLFKYFEKYPEQGEIFNIFQKISTSNQVRWTSIYPCHTLLDSDLKLPLFVDVGGSIGHDVYAFYEKYPETASRLYLEDIPSVIADDKSLVMEGVNKLTYNFFTPQPVKHARVYYMHHILHDWPDRQARKILEMQKVAMKPGYSKILIHDHVMDDDGTTHPHAAGFDIAMMAFGAAQERTEKEWRALIAPTGLKVTKIWKVPHGPQGVIEVELAGEKPKL